jgi:hypothetical protein
MHRGRIIRVFFVCMLIAVARSGTAWAIEAKSGNASQTAANASEGPKDDSQIVLGSGQAECPFEDQGIPALDNNEYFECIADELHVFGYHSTYSPGDFKIQVFESDWSEPEGLCYAEQDRDIKWIAIEIPPTAPARYAKIGKFHATGSGPPAQITIQINDDEPIPIVTESGVNPNDAIFAALSKDYDVSDGTTAFVITDVMARKLSITSTDRSAYATMIALEPDGSPDSTYCWSLGGP